MQSMSGAERARPISTRNGLLSIILLSYNSGDRLRVAHAKLDALMKREGIPYELIIIDDGSQDDSPHVAESLARMHANVRAYRLSRNFTSHYAIFAGLSVCKGACAAPIPDDEQQPYELLVRMYRLWQEGRQVIIPHRTTRDDPPVSRFFSRVFYNVMNRFSEVKFPDGGADLFFIDREVVDILNNRIHPIRTASITEVLRLGFDPIFLPFDRPRGLNPKGSRWTLKKKIRLAADTFISSSSFPIKLIVFIGFVSSSMALVGMLFYLAAGLFGDRIFLSNTFPPGWISLVLLIFFFSGLILLSLGVLAEYIWRIYEEVKARPGYLIRRKPDEVADTGDDPQ